METLGTVRGPFAIRRALFGKQWLILEASLSPLPFRYRITDKPYSIFSQLIRSSIVLMLLALPFIHYGNLQRVMQKSRNGASCPPAEFAEFKSSAIFGPSGNEGAVRKAGHLEWQHKPIPQLRSHQCSFRPHQFYYQSSAYALLMCGVSKLLRCERSCKNGLAFNGSQLMTVLWSCQGEVEFVTICGCSDRNVSNLYTLCTAHSYVRYIAQTANKIVYFTGKQRYLLPSSIRSTPYEVTQVWLHIFRTQALDDVRIWLKSQAVYPRAKSPIPNLQGA